MHKTALHKSPMHKSPVQKSPVQKSLTVAFTALIASFFVNIPLYEGSTKNTLNLFHVLIAVLFVWTIQFRPRFRVSADTLFLTTLTVTAVLGWAVFGMSTRPFLLPLILLTFIVGNRWYQLTTKEERLVTYQRVFAFVILAIVIRNLLHFDSLGSLYGRARTENQGFYLSSGGRNLEATQLGMLSTLLIGTFAFLPAIVVAAITSLLVMSRAGILAVLIALTMWLIHGQFGRWKLYLGSLMLAGTALAVLAQFEGTYEIPILNRFDLSTEQDLAADDQGRLAIWSAAVEVLKENPLGYGTGNGFSKLNDHIGGHLRENNAHNVLVEFAIDGGLQSAVLFVAIMFCIVRSPNLMESPHHRFALAYGILGLVEYTGYDTIGWFFIGVSHAARNETIPTSEPLR